MKYKGERFTIPPQEDTNGLQGIYRITNSRNALCYIGSSVNLYLRINGHIRDLVSNKHHARHLQNFFNKYEEVTFEIEVLEYTHGFSTEERLAREQNWIDVLEVYKNDKGFNTRPFVNSNKGYIATEETREKLSLSLKKYYAENDHHALGKPGKDKGKPKHSEEQKRKWSEQYKGVKTGRVPTEEARNKISERKSIPVIQLSLSGEFIQEFKSATQAGKILNIRKSDINRICRGKGKTAGGFKFRYLDEELHSKYENKVEDRIQVKCEPINQIDENGNIIKQFEDSKDVMKEFSLSRQTLWMVCSGRYLSTENKLRFEYADPDKKKIADELRERKYPTGRLSSIELTSFPIDMFDLFGNFIQSFSSLSEASRELKIHRMRIREVCEGWAANYKNYKFEFQDENRKAKAAQNRLNNAPLWEKKGKRLGPIKQLDLEGNLINIFNGLKAASAELKISVNDIYKICVGELVQKPDYKLERDVISQ